MQRTTEHPCVVQQRYCNVDFDARSLAFFAPLGLWWRRRRNRLDLPEIGELDLAAIEREIVFEDDVQGGAAWQLRFRPAGQEYGGQSRGRPDPRADAKSFHSVGDGPNSCASGGRLRDGA